MDGAALSLRPASAGDLALLAAMKRRLIEDEGSYNPMALPELEQRMRALLEGGWRVDLFCVGAACAGYALYQLRRDDYDPQLQVVFVRHFYLERDLRGHGLGRQAFELLAAKRFPAGCQVALDVLASNPAGLAFWTRLGFQLYATSLKLNLKFEI
jgi:GNAT superfamily N-acetyltransferase